MKFKRSLRFASAPGNSPLTGNTQPATTDKTEGRLHLVFRAPPPVIEETVLHLSFFAAVRRTAPEYATEIGLRALELILPHLSHRLEIPDLALRRKAMLSPPENCLLAA